MSDGRIGGGLNVSRALGDWRYKDNDTLPLELQMVSPLPDIKELALEVRMGSDDCVGSYTHLQCLFPQSQRTSLS